MYIFVYMFKIEKSLLGGIPAYALYLLQGSKAIAMLLTSFVCNRMP